MKEAKSIQQEWKKIGPTSYKEDKKYWDAFRAACDKIFEQRNQHAHEMMEHIRQAEERIENVLKSLEQIFKLDDEDFRKERNRYKDLLQEFSASLDPGIKKNRKRFLDQFNGLKRNIERRFKTLPDKKRVQLVNSLIEKSTYCQELETKLLETKSDNEFKKIREELDKERWNAIEDSGNADYDNALEERLKRIVETDSLPKLEALTGGYEKQILHLCIELEIRANIDSPQQDQPLRMQIQLDQLKNGFGRAKPNHEENSKFALDAELRSLCLGPLTKSSHRGLTERLAQALKKLR